MRTGLLIAALMVLAGCMGAGAAMKVVSASSKKAPSWIGTAEEGYIIVSCVEPTLAKAQETAEQMIAERVVSAIARNVVTSSTSQISESIVNGTVESSDEFSRMTSMMAARLPFVSGISLSNVDGSYWVCRRDKKTGMESYEFHARYPFSVATMKRLTAEFEAYDAEQVARLEALETGIDTVDTIDGITAGVGEAEALEAYFFDDTRRKRAQSMAKRYAAISKEVTMSLRETSPGHARLEFMLHGHPFKVYSKPVVTSECARIVSIDPDEGSFDIVYDTADCLADEPNMINVAVKVGSGRLKSQIDIAVPDPTRESDALRLLPRGPMTVIADDIDAETREISGVTYKFSVDNTDGVTFGIASLELRLPELKLPVITQDYDAVFSGKGIIEIVVASGSDNLVLEQRSGALKIARLTMVAVNPATMAKETVSLSFPYTTNF